MQIEIQKIRAAIEHAGTVRGAAAKLGMPESTIRARLKRAQSDELDIEPGAVPRDIQALIAERVEKFAHKQSSQRANFIRTVRLRSNEPIGIGFQGDGHLDDDGTDLRKFFEHAKLFDGRHAGLHLGFLGDIWNNWVGRLTRLYANQSTSAAEAQQLCEHYAQMCNFLFFLLGNHDLWNGKEDILQYIFRASCDMVVAHEQRVRLVFPNKREVMIHARHKFPGHSQWTTQFGQIKAAQLDGMADIYVGGDKHVSGYSNGIHPGTRRMYHALQVASYKSVDDYPVELGLPAKDLYVCPIAVINPNAKDPLNLIRWEFDPNEGAARLKWERSRR